MYLTKSPKFDINYLAKIVDIQKFNTHPNPKYTKLKMAVIDGYNCIVSIDMDPGLFVYFPVMCTINPQLLSYLNLYSDTEYNRDSNKSGFFKKNGMVKAIKLGGAVSEGFLLPINEFLSWIQDSVMISEISNLIPDVEFDTVEHHGKSFWVCKKYIVETNIKGSSQKKNKLRDQNLKKFDKLIPKQFNFHYDTILLKKEPDAIQPTDLISITSKWHGSSVIVSRVLCKHPRKLWDKIITWIYKVLGGTLSCYTTPEYYPEYDYIYSSRNVIKNSMVSLDNPNTEKTGFYDVDIWWYGYQYLKPYLDKGMSIYAEIVGFLPNGQFIQKPYDYGCIPPKSEKDYVYGIHYKVMVYRITQTNIDGKVYEYSAKQVQDFCNNIGLTPVIEFYYGVAKNLYPDIELDDNWNINFIEHLSNDERFYMEKKSPDCMNDVPHEGIVIKKEDGVAHAWKLKSFAFVSGEQKSLDNGTGDIENEN